MCFVFGIVAEDKLSRVLFERAKKQWEAKAGKDWEMVEEESENGRWWNTVDHLFFYFVNFFI